MLVAMVIAPGTPAWDDDIGFLLVIAGVEDGEHLGLGGALVAGIERGERVGIGEVVLLPAVLAQHLGKLLGFLDRGGADQHRLAARLAVLDQRHDGAELLRRGAIDLVVVVDAATIGLLVGISRTSRL